MNEHRTVKKKAKCALRVLRELGAIKNARMPAPQQITSIRDRHGLVPTEDIGRGPDGVPHAVVGLSALFSVLFAVVVLGMWLSGPTGRIAAVAICMVGIPMLLRK